MNGYVYLATNPFLSGLIKIGLSKDVHKRVKGLSNSSVPGDYRIEHAQVFEDARAAERWIHDKLANKRVSASKEFFSCSIAEAMTAINEYSQLTTHSVVNSSTKSSMGPPFLDKYGEDEKRFLINQKSRYDQWISAQSIILRGRLQWKGPKNHPSLYRMFDGFGNGTSVGPSSPHTIAMYEEYQRSKAIKSNMEKLWEMGGRQHAALSLPTLHPHAGSILRSLDAYGYMASAYVVGDHALLAYQIEAMVRIPWSVMHSEPFSLCMRGRCVEKVENSRGPKTIFQVLKRVDPTYTINTERPFQARNRNGDEIELLLPAELIGTLPEKEAFRPVPLREQDWLMMGHGVDHVIFDTDNRPARIIAPDPRYFALQKMWLSNKPKRNPLKIDKDAMQGRLILDLVAERMPHYPLSDDFGAGLPNELLLYFQQWKAQRDISNANTIKNIPKP